MFLHWAESAADRLAAPPVEKSKQPGDEGASDKPSMDHFQKSAGEC